MHRLTLTLAAGMTALSASLAAQDVLVEGSRLVLGSAPVTSAAPGPAAADPLVGRTGGGPGAIDAGFLGGGDLFGKDIARSGDYVLIADATDAYMRNTATGVWEVLSMVSLIPGAPAVVEMLSLDVDGDHAALSYAMSGGLSVEAVFVHDGTAWTHSSSQIGLDGEVHVSLHDGLLFKTQQILSFTGSLFAVRDLATNIQLAAALIDGDAYIALDAGDGPTPGDPLSILVTTESGVTREVLALTLDGTTLVDHGVIASGSIADEFGQAVAIDDGTAWIGVPGHDGAGPGTDSGQVLLYEDLGAGNLSLLATVASAQAGDRMGRAVAVDGALTAFGEKEADLLPGSVGRGAVRLVREVADVYYLTGEIHNIADPVNYQDYGAAIDLDGTRMAVGAPGTTSDFGSWWWWNLSADAVLSQGLAPGLAGFGGAVPSGAALGTTFWGTPFLVEVLGARPSASAFLIVGAINISAPFKGGVMLPSPDLVLNLSTDASGTLQVFTAWPSGFFGPFDLFMQVWVQDPDGPGGFAATQGFSATQPF